MTTEKITAEHPDWCRAAFQRSQAGDYAGAMAIIEEKVGPDIRRSQLTVELWRFARSWDGSKGLPMLEEAVLRQQAAHHTGGDDDDWACVRTLVAMHMDRASAVMRVNYTRVPDRVKMTARTMIWDRMFTAIVKHYPWLEDAVAETEAERVLGYAMPSIEPIAAMVAFYSAHLPRFSQGAKP
jgi:hypothetical protein